MHHDVPELYQLLERFLVRSLLGFRKNNTR